MRPYIFKKTKEYLLKVMLNTAGSSLGTFDGFVAFALCKSHLHTVHRWLLDSHFPSSFLGEASGDALRTCHLVCQVALSSVCASVLTGRVHWCVFQ